MSHRGGPMGPSDETATHARAALAEGSRWHATVSTPQTVGLAHAGPHARTRQAGIRARKGQKGHAARVFCQHRVFPGAPRICCCRPRRRPVTARSAGSVSSQGRSALSLAYRCGGSQGMGRRHRCCGLHPVPVYSAWRACRHLAHGCPGLDPEGGRIIGWGCPAAARLR